MEKLNKMTLQNEILQYTLLTSKYENKRRYISLSQIANCPRKIYNDYVNGCETDVIGHLKCRKGYQEEADLKNRLFRIYGDNFNPNPDEIVLYKGLVKGHPDGALNGHLIEIKSYALDRYLPDEQRIPKRIYWQVQAYLAFDEYKHPAFLICESRESGVIKVCEVKYNMSVIDQIQIKLAVITEAVLRRNPPHCECGKCKQ